MPHWQRNLTQGDWSSSLTGKYNTGVTDCRYHINHINVPGTWHFVKGDVV